MFRTIAFAALLVASIVALPDATAANPVAGPIEPSPLVVELRPFAFVPDSSSGTPPRLNAIATNGERTFVVAEGDGLVYELVGDIGQPGATTTELAEPVLFLDVGAAVAQSTGRSLDRTNAFHGGLRGLAFHPDFATNGRFYVSMLETRPAAPEGHSYLGSADSTIGGDSVVAEFRVDVNTGQVDTTSYREVFRVALPEYDHPIKQIAFNPNAEPGDEDYGLLYVGHGDGSVFSSNAGTGLANDGLGKILRVDPVENATASYQVPATNPFVGDPSMLDEVFALGFRNPHHLAFSRSEVGPLGGGAVLIVADAGRDNVEEINVVTPGANHGWSAREGTFVHLGPGVSSGVAPLPADEALAGFVYPAAQYGHVGPAGSSLSGEAVAGGFAVENGSVLSGHYFYADFPSSGRLFHSSVGDLEAAVTALDPDDPSRDEPTELAPATVFEVTTIEFDHDNDRSTPSLDRTSLRDVFDDAPTYETRRADVRFGQGPGGELFVMSKRNNLVYVVENSIPESAAEEPDPDPQRGEPQEPQCVELTAATTLSEVVGSCGYGPGDAEVLRLYRAFFDRAPEVGGARYWIERRDTGTTFDEIALFFSVSPEFVATYGPSVANEEFLEILYLNAFGRAYDQGGFDYWLNRIDNEGLARHLVVRFVAGSPEFVAAYPYQAD